MAGALHLQSPCGKAGLSEPTHARRAHLTRPSSLPSKPSTSQRKCSFQTVLSPQLSAAQPLPPEEHLAGSTGLLVSRQRLILVQDVSPHLLLGAMEGTGLVVWLLFSFKLKRGQVCLWVQEQVTEDPRPVVPLKGSWPGHDTNQTLSPG